MTSTPLSKRQTTAFLTKDRLSRKQTNLFPKILKYEYYLTHARAEPDFSEGSITVFSALHLMRSEQKQVSAIRDFLDAASFSTDPTEMGASATGLFRLLESFQGRLLEHSRMEREILFPRAEALEREICDLYIGGGAKTRIPMEKGDSPVRALIR